MCCARPARGQPRCCSAICSLLYTAALQAAACRSAFLSKTIEHLQTLACVVAAAMTHPRHHGPHALAAPSSRKTFFIKATCTYYCCAGAVCGMRPAVHARPSSLAPTFADAENPETIAEAHLLSCDATKMSRCVHASLLCSDLFWRRSSAKAASLALYLLLSMSERV